MTSGTVKVRHIHSKSESGVGKRQHLPEFLPEYVYGFDKGKSIVKVVILVRRLLFPSSCHKKASFSLKPALNFREIKSGGRRKRGKRPFASKNK